MRSSWGFTILLSVLVPLAYVHAQTGGQPTVTSGQPVRFPSDSARDRSEADIERRIANMRHLEKRLRAATREPRKLPEEPRLSDEQKDRVRKLRLVGVADIEKYNQLLKGEHTGIFKIFPNLGCVSKSVVRISSECERFVPMSSSFTFRTNSYSDDVYHDIFFKDERLSSNSFFSQAIFGAIGDEPIESISLDHNALKFLVSYQGDADPKLAGEHARQFQTGVDSDGFRYADHVTPQVNTTYAVRMIAYRLENVLKPLSDETTMTEMMFLSLAFDKRIDLVVVFRVLARDEYGGLTIVWKELSRQDAPKIKFAKNQALKDFRPTQKN